MGWRLAVLNTVGTSILSNLEGSVKDCELGGRRLSQTLCQLLGRRPSRASPSDSIQEEFLKRATPSDPVFREVLES